LLAAVVGQHPQLANQLGELSADPAPVDANPAGDAYAVRVFAVGRRPLIGRPSLRTVLREFMEEQAPVLVIRGAATGKSYSYELIQHVAKSVAGLVLRDVTFGVADGNGAVDLMAKLCRRLKLNDVSGRDSLTTSTRNATDMVDDFIGEYPTDGSVRRILVIDGLDRTDLKPDVYQMVAQLIVEVFRGQLANTQLVLTGYSGSYDRQYDGSVKIDDVEPILESDVRDYFTGLVLDRPLPAKEVASLVQKALRGNGGVEALAGRVRGLTLELLQPTGANP
jgi:hypothetical protein